MRTVTTTVYTYDELSEDAQAVARDWYREGDDLPFMEDDMTEYLGELLTKNKLEGDATIRYSLSYSQGDGASFTGDFEYNKTWRVSIEGNHLSNHYSHWNTVDVTDVNSLKTDKDAPVATYQKVEQIVVKISKELERYGYEYIESMHSDESVADTILANEYEFNADGSRA